MTWTNLSLLHRAVSTSRRRWHSIAEVGNALLDEANTFLSVAVG